MKLDDKYKKAIEALELIEIGMGPYNRNPLTFANNVIEALKNIAKECLDELEIVRENSTPC